MYIEYKCDVCYSVELNLQGYGCFNGFVISMLLVYLLNHRKLHKLMTSYQILRITLEHLG